MPSKYSNAYLAGLIEPNTKENNGRFGADLILGLLSAKRRRNNAPVDNSQTTGVTEVSLSAHEAAQLYNDYMRASKLPHKTLDQGNIPVRNEKELERWKQELDEAYDTNGSDARSPSAVGSQRGFGKTSLKNYQGRHNQETHTTLYNIAHPSQGRGSQGASNAADIPKDIYRQAGIRGVAEPLSRTMPQVDINTSKLSAAQVFALNNDIFSLLSENYGIQDRGQATKLMQDAQNAMPSATQLGTDTFVTELSKWDIAKKEASKLLGSKPDDAFMKDIVKAYPNSLMIPPAIEPIRHRIINLLAAMETRLLAEISLWKADPDKPFVNVFDSRSIAGSVARRLGSRNRILSFPSDFKVYIMRNLVGELTGLMYTHQLPRQVDAREGFDVDVVKLLGANPSSTNRSGEALLINLARDSVARDMGIQLDAKVSALPFYYKMGFRPRRPLPSPFFEGEPDDTDLLLSREGTAALAQRKIKELTRERILATQKIQKNKRGKLLHH